MISKRQGTDRGAAARIAVASAAAVALLGCSAPALASAAPAKGKKPKSKPKLNRPSDPVVLSGARLTPLLGLAPDRLLAFRYKPAKRGDGRWIRVPVQVDERALVDFGQNPASSSIPLNGARSVYGTAPLGQTALQYTDPNTFVGPDPDPALDGDDEVVFMASDAGARAPGSTSSPKGARLKGGLRVTVRDPINGAKRWLYLLPAAAKGPAKKGAARDYVSYAFRLLSGDYRASYDRRSGPNPEQSTVSTPFYTAGFSDRWYFDQLRISNGGASGAEILDGYKFMFNNLSCGRSEATFNSGEGAFVANKDGPVRAIRSYVGANSGPYTQRTHFLYAQRQEIVTNLRVHPVPAPFTYYDLGPEAAGMTYLNQLRQSGVTVDGSPDAISGGPAVDWHLWRGAQGAMFVADRVSTSIATAGKANSTAFYEDNSSAPSFTQCWGDPDLFGAAGILVAGNLPSTDVGAADFLRASSVSVYGAPDTSAAAADLLSRQLDSPLATSLARLKR